jgi:hypothetical protein
MKRFFAFLGVMALVVSFATSSMADWSKCKGCHNGSVAPSAEQMKAKFKTADEVVAAAKASQNPMMKGVQGNEEALKAAAEAMLAEPAPAK